MAKRLDDNEAAFLLALREQDPEGEYWIAAWRLMGDAGARGADTIASETPEGAFSVMKRLYSRKLVDKQPGRSTKLHNGYAINAAGKEALEKLHEEGRG